MEAEVARLRDELDVLRVVASYGPSVDGGAVDAAPGFWTEDCIYDSDADEPLRGRAAIAALSQRVGHLPIGAAHFLNLPIVVVDGDPRDSDLRIEHLPPRERAVPGGPGERQPLGAGARSREVAYPLTGEPDPRRDARRPGPFGSRDRGIHRVMAMIRPNHFHRLALAVDDVGVATAWLGRMLGGIPIGGSETLMQSRPDRDVGDLAGTDTRVLWVGGYPVILLGGGVVARFLERHGPGVQSWAWEVADNWEVEHIVRDRGIDVISPNIAGRFFFMQPKQTHGLLWEWCDGKMPRDACVRPGPERGW